MSYLMIKRLIRGALGEMDLAGQIIEKIRNEISSYKTSRGKKQKLLYQKTTDELLTKLEKFIESYLKSESLEEITNEEFTEKLYDALGWRAE